MARQKAAGVLLYRLRDSLLEVFLVHPGGPFWRKKDDGAWSIPKGELQEGEDPLEAAKREFQEETGFRPEGDFIALPPLRQAGGKLVHAWAVRGDCDANLIRSNVFSIEWPPRSGKQEKFPEVDRAGWFTLEIAKRKILRSQTGLLEELRRVAEPT
jgi:predicted NUDIX family NTP pyrophosphohydrolase